MGGPPTDLKNMADRPEWKGQSFFKKICKKAFIIKKCFTQHDAKYFFSFFKEMVRIDLFNMENLKYMARIVLTVHVFDFVV